MSRMNPWMALVAATVLSACGMPANPADGGTDAGVDGGTGGEDAGSCSGGQVRAGGACSAWVEDLSSCTPDATDYQPRDGVPGDDGWPACISDDNTYHLVGSGLPAAAARTAAFDAMALKLWKNPSVPTAADFLSARDDYSVAQGLASRVARRQDVTYPEVPGGDKFACQSAGIPEQYPDRCVGPAKLKPLVDDAFQKGAACEKPLVQAARIEAALLWFLHLSMTSEVWTCSFEKREDCDAAMGYYATEPVRSSHTGYAGYVHALAPASHDAIFDALLAVRCWRDADTALPAANMALYDLAQAQVLDASLRGMAVVLRDRVGKLACTQGEELEAHQAFVQVIGGFLVHAAEPRNAQAAARLGAFAAAPSGDAAAVAALQADLDTLFSCP
ncbi:MAG: hypothetical protein RL653_1553 [Pseudomonadota bacterium]